MPKDFKIGMMLGLMLVITAMLWLATCPSLNPQARMLNSPPIASLLETSGAPNNLSTIGSIPQSAENNQLSIIDNQSKLPDLTVYEQAEKIQTTKFHIVRKGDTLSAISAKYYGSANKWQRILDANRSQLKNAKKLRPGTKLVIPQ